MKANESTENEAAAIEITESAIHSRIAEVAKALEIPAETCTNSQYGQLLIATLHKFAAPDPESFLASGLKVWAFFPKNPSAMRQHLNRKEKEASDPKVDAMVAKLKGL